MIRCIHTVQRTRVVRSENFDFQCLPVASISSAVVSQQRLSDTNQYVFQYFMVNMFSSTCYDDVEAHALPSLHSFDSAATVTEDVFLRKCGGTYAPVCAFRRAGGTKALFFRNLGGT